MVQHAFYVLIGFGGKAEDLHALFWLEVVVVFEVVVFGSICKARMARQIRKLFKMQIKIGYCSNYTYIKHITTFITITI